MKLAVPIIAGFYALDQATKIWIKSRLVLHDEIPVVPGFFSIVHVWNTGAAFGSFKDGNGFFIGISFLALVVLAVLAWRGQFRDRWSGVAVSLLTSGILGNLTDRLAYGHVTDFLDFYWRDWHWPAFNVADSCICVAAAMLAIAGFFAGEEKADG